MSSAHIRSLGCVALVFATFSGHVVDVTTGQPMPGVHIHLAGAATSDVTTDAAGRFVIRRLRPGGYTISVESDDVPEQDFPVKLVANRITVLDLKVCSTTLDYHCGGPGGGG